MLVAALDATEARGKTALRWPHSRATRRRRRSTTRSARSPSRRATQADLRARAASARRRAGPDATGDGSALRGGGFDSVRRRPRKGGDVDREKAASPRARPAFDGHSAAFSSGSSSARAGSWPAHGSIICLDEAAVRAAGREDHRPQLLHARDVDALSTDTPVAMGPSLIAARARREQGRDVGRNRQGGRRRLAPALAARARRGCSCASAGLRRFFGGPGHLARPVGVRPHATARTLSQSPPPRHLDRQSRK